MRVFALFGNPVGHSLSPAMHNAAYRKMGLDAIYLPFCISALREAVKGMKALGIEGASVTIPFKTEIIPLLDRVDKDSRAIGAVNTVVRRGGKLIGGNTDWIGLSRALRERIEIKGKTFAVLGAGGAARAAVHAVLSEGGIPVVVYRSKKRGLEVAGQFGCRSVPFAKIGEIEADCLLNATPVGMVPDIEKTPVDRSLLPRFRWVAETIYNPLETRLLREARAAGCKIVPGLDMFIYQGAEQIRIWTGENPPLQLMRRTVEKILKTERVG